MKINFTVNYSVDIETEYYETNHSLFSLRDIIKFELKNNPDSFLDSCNINEENITANSDTTKLFKIIGTSNFDSEMVSDVLVADNMVVYYANAIMKHLESLNTSHSTYYYKIVPQEYVLYEWSP